MDGHLAFISFDQLGRLRGEDLVEGFFGRHVQLGPPHLELLVMATSFLLHREIRRCDRLLLVVEPDAVELGVEARLKAQLSHVKRLRRMRVLFYMYP